MPICEASAGPLYYEVFDARAPWKESRDTVLFHHGVGCNLDLWKEWLPCFLPDFRLIAFDMRGFGRSSMSEQDFKWSIEQLTLDVLDILQASGTDRVHFVGESMGGTVGMYLAEHHGERLLSLTASNAAARGRLVRNLTSWRSLIETRGQREWARKMMEWRFYPDALPPAKYEWLYEQHTRCSADAVIALAELLSSLDISEDLNRIRVPTLLLSPDASPFVPASHMADIHCQIEGAELQIFAHARHGLPFSHAAACAAATKSFLDRHSSTGSPNSTRRR